MKFQIDDVEKIIRIEEKVNLDELYKKLNFLFPNETWKEYMLETNTIITEWKDSIIITEPYPIYPQPLPYPINPWPWWQPVITCYDNLLSTNSSKTTIYNIEY
jgi:hypothetical protein